MATTGLSVRSETASSVFTEESLRERITPYHSEAYRRDAVKNQPLGQLKPSAVLIPLLIRDGQVRVLLTKRTDNLASHSGDVCFPGGRMDPSDVSEEAACLREAEEEIGLSPQDVQILAKSTPVISKFNFLVNPVVGIIPESFKPKPNTDEVQDVFDLPLERFLSTDNMKVSVFNFHGFDLNVPHFHDLVGEKQFTTWGLTAFMCITIAVIVFQRPSGYCMVSGFPVTPENPRVISELQLEYWQKSHRGKI